VTEVLGDVGQVLSLVLLVLGVVAVYAAALALWQPALRSARRWTPFALMVAGAVLILAGLVIR